MNINGNSYCEVGNRIIYYLCKLSRSSEDSLVDVGANSGVADNDDVVVAKHPSGQLTSVALIITK